MNISRLAIVTSVALLAALALSAPAYARDVTHNPQAGIKPHSKFDQPQSHNGRQKMQLSVRKAAAKRLRTLHNQARAQHLQEQINQHGHKG